MTPNTAMKESLKLIAGALRLSQHVLQVNPFQLACQLTGRLLAIKDSGAAALLENLKKIKTKPWLCPVTPCFISPKESLIMTLTGHTSSVNALALTPDGLRAASGSLDKTIRIWDLELGLELQVLKGHKETVNALAISPDGRTLVSASGLTYDPDYSKDKSIRIWDLERGKEKMKLECYPGSNGFGEFFGPVHTLALTPDCSKVIAVSVDRAMVWDLSTGTIISSLTEHEFYYQNALALALEAGLIVVRTYQDPLKKNCLKVWNFQDNRETIFEVASDSVDSLAITPDGCKVSLGYDDGMLAVWDLKTGRMLNSWAGHRKSVDKIALMREGKRAISISNGEKSAKIWELDSGRVLLTRKLDSYVSKISTTPDGKIAVLGSLDGMLMVLNVETGAVSKLDDHSDSINDMVITQTGHWLVTASADKTIKKWDLNAISDSHRKRDHRGRIEAIAVSPDGRLALSGAVDETLKLWDLTTGKHLKTFKGHKACVHSVAFSPDGRLAVSGAGDPSNRTLDNTVRIWEVESGDEVRVLKGHTHMVSAVIVSPDGRHVISGGWDGQVIIWNLETGVKIHYFFLEHDISLEEIWEDLDENDREIIGNPYDDKPPHIHTISFGPDGRCWILPLAEKPKILDLEKGLLLISELKFKNADTPTVLAVPQNGRQAVIGLFSRELGVFDCVSGDLLHLLDRHTEDISSVAVTSDGETAVSASRDSTIRLWNLSNGQELAAFFTEIEIGACSLTPDGLRVVAGGAAGRLYFLQLKGNIEHPSSDP